MMKVVQARLINHRPPTSLFSALSLSSSSSAVRRRTNTVRFVQSEPDNASTSHQEMDDKDKEKAMTRNPNDTTGDVMSHSFGEGYATRSDEEGFGGIYAGNCHPNNQPHKPVIHENHPEYDRNQGSQVSGKEKARNQEKVDH